MLTAYGNDILKLGLRIVDLETNSRGLEDMRGNITAFIPGHMPWSHGLFMSLVWTFLAAGVAYLVYKDRRSTLIFGLLVSSHWILDFIVHPAELPLLFSDSNLVGLGLWSTVNGYRIAWALELIMMAGGLAIYLMQRKRLRRPSIEDNHHR